jgi:hypothetical protein
MIPLLLVFWFIDAVRKISLAMEQMACGPSLYERSVQHSTDFSNAVASQQLDYFLLEYPIQVVFFVLTDETAENDFRIAGPDCLD